MYLSQGFRSMLAPPCKVGQLFHNRHLYLITFNTGINSFGGTATINNVSITGSGGTNGDQYIISPLTAVMDNPSNISLSTVDIALPVYYENVMIGRAAFNVSQRLIHGSSVLNSAFSQTFNLMPGENAMAGEFQYEPVDANDTVAESFLTSFVQTGSVLPLTVQGDSASSPFTSLNPALEGVTLQTSVTGEYGKRHSVHVH